jgi:hypothetical protein
MQILLLFVVCCESEEKWRLQIFDYKKSKYENPKKQRLQRYYGEK